MKINIFGSTGNIGKKTLNLIEKFFPQLKVNLLCAKSNTNLLIRQIEKFQPRYVFLYDNFKVKHLKSNISKKTKILNFDELNSYLISSKSDLSLLSISGYNSLLFLEQIINNTSNLGLVSKEAIVSAGHIFKKKKFFSKTKIFPLDSEHFSIFDYLNDSIINNSIKNLIITASGGPFLNKPYNSLHNIQFEQAIKHPKWRMGHKNSIDSATLVNKCLEIIEAHYLFDIPFEKIDILIHPDAIVHSIIQKNNYVTNMNLFKNDMNIPLINFLMKSQKISINYNSNFNLPKISNYNFQEVKISNFPIYKFFKDLDKDNPENLIKFNIGNELAVNLFKKKLIRYTDIYKIIEKATSLNLYSSLNSIKSIINYHDEVEKTLQELY